MTDFPSFISRRSLIFFDPHGAAIQGTSREEPGREWNVAAEKWYEQYPDFMKVYEAGGLLFGTEDFQGTLLGSILISYQLNLFSSLSKIIK